MEDVSQACAGWTGRGCCCREVAATVHTADAYWRGAVKGACSLPQFLRESLSTPRGSQGATHGSTFGNILTTRDHAFLLSPPCY